MTMNPVDYKPIDKFSIEASNIEPSTTEPIPRSNFEINDGIVYMELYYNGVSLGWLGRDSEGWGRLVNRSRALALQLYPYNGVNYYKIPGEKQYMSINRNAYVGFYSWSGAVGWTREGNGLKCDDNRQFLSLYSRDDGYLYCWDAYTRLDVSTVATP